MLDISKNTVLRANSDSLLDNLIVDPQFNKFRFLNVMPEPEYRNYGTVFMSAMQRELIWLYKGDIPEVVPPSISTGFCIRTDKGFSNAGSSNRHLKCFEMLTLAGQMPEEQMLESIIDLLKEKIPSDTTIIANLHPDDEIAQIFFKERNISFLLKEKCHFREPDKTDREGHRVEINLKAVRDEQEIQWEVFNCVVITSTDNGEKKLSTPLIEASGSSAIRRYMDYCY